jgi:ubiquitin-like-conjugating enzyme ATG3
MNLLHSVREYLNPLLKESKFKETGVLTPEEFVAAGDFLVFKCPTWSWASGEKQRDYLPADKQYLITRGVPCLKRIRDMEYGGEEIMLEDEWIGTHGQMKRMTEEEMMDINPEIPEVNDIPDMDDIPDIDLLEEALTTPQDTAALSMNQILQTRYVECIHW